MWNESAASALFRSAKLYSAAAGRMLAHQDTQARAQLEQRWVPWNVVPTVSSTAAFVCLALSLLRVR